MQQANGVYIFWDNSNIYHGAQRAAKTLSPLDSSAHTRVYFRNLIQFVLRGRPLLGTFVCGSVPPPNDEVWKYFHDILRVNPVLYKRVTDDDGRSMEQGVDERIHLAMLETILDQTPATIALLTGDGKNITPGTGFLSNLRRAVKVAWSIEVYSWDEQMHGRMRDYANANGKYHPLDPHFFELTFVPEAEGVFPRYVRQLGA